MGLQKNNYRMQANEMLDVLSQTDPDPIELMSARAHLSSWRQMGTGSLEELKQRREALVAWRDIMPPILDSSRLRMTREPAEGRT
jgi:hypothetical protein